MISLPFFGYRSSYADRNDRKSCLCGAARGHVPDHVWAVTDKETDLILPKYYYGCPHCHSFSALNLYFPVDKYEDVPISAMHISNLKISLNHERLAWISSQVNFSDDPVLFDLGAGEGCFSHVFAEKYTRGLVYAVEADTRIEEQFYKKNPRVRFVPRYIEDFLRDSMDLGIPRPNLVLLTDVLEHVLEPEQLLRDVAEILAEDGYVYITVPDTSTFQPPFPYKVHRRQVDWAQANRTCQHLWMMEPETLQLLIEKDFRILATDHDLEANIRRDSGYSTVLAMRR